jgi:hypothetical protein
MMQRTENWTDLLLPVEPPTSTASAPFDVMDRLIDCLRGGDDRVHHGLMAASLIRSWWQSLDDRGQRLDPYQGLTGDGYLWSTLGLVALAVQRSRTSSEGLWNVLRRAEANMRAWWLEQETKDSVVVLFETDISTLESTIAGFVEVNYGGSTITTSAIPGRRSRRVTQIGWEWVKGEQ